VSGKRNSKQKETKMKVCKICGDEISTRDGENICDGCENANQNMDKKAKAKRRNAGRIRDEIMKDLGMTRVRGAMGGIYYE
jgi:hypothetical protein